MRDHPDLDTRGSKNPFDKFPVLACRVERGTDATDYFIVIEIDLPKDDLGPRTRPEPRTEAEARARLAELGLSEPDTEVRIQWARNWMTTSIVAPGAEPWFFRS